MKNKSTTISQSLKSYVEHAYLDYAMYVILDRALPHIGDGLKPVQRRIVYAMSELNLSAQAKYKKSARTVGDVIGKFHPHGDSAAYEAMVIMAQDFNYRYPLVDGQGNWGSLDDPKSFAAMRYTEARLSAYANILLAELDQGTVQWTDNFDGTLKEPTILPAQLPNILLNGSSGIAVGMSTDIPPHNLTEVAQACIALLDKPNITLEDILQYIPAPDYPTSAPIISSKQEVAAIYAVGKGTISQRSSWEKQDSCIIINALPYQVPIVRVLPQMANSLKNLPQVIDLRDESDHQQSVRIVLELKSARVDAEQIMLHLFATTDLETTHRINLNMIDSSGSPRVMDLRQILVEWLEFRKEVIQNRLTYRLEAIRRRLHFLEGFLIAFLNLDRVIDIVRNEDAPKPTLIKEFKLTQEQVNYILETRLRQLAKLEEMKIRQEYQALDKEASGLEIVLSSEQRLKTLMKKEIKALASQFGNARQSPILEEPVIKAGAFSEEDILPSEPVTCIISKHGWARLAKGHNIDAKGLKFKTGDSYLTHEIGLSKNKLIVLDNQGRSYSLSPHLLPSARTMGDPLTGHISPPQGASIIKALLPKPKDVAVLLSSAGYGFSILAEQMYSSKRGGKHIISLQDNILSFVGVVRDYDLLAIFSSEGKLLIVDIASIPTLAKGKGRRVMNIGKAYHLAAVALVSSKKRMKIWTQGKRSLNFSQDDMANYRADIGKKGFKLPKGFQNISIIEPIE